ncbi:MAG: hypothetical protein ACR2GX_03265 [Candidatus Dormibacteria bacterium]
MSTPAIPVTQAIPGEPDHFNAMAGTFSAVADAVRSAQNTVQNHRIQLFHHWQSANAELPLNQMDDAARWLHSGHHNLGQVAGILKRHAHALTQARADYTAAAGIVQAQAVSPLAAAPLVPAAGPLAPGANPLAPPAIDPTVQHDLQLAQTKMQKAIAMAQQSATSTMHALEHLMAPALAVTAKGNLGPGTALLLDSAVAAHTLSRSHAVKAGARLSTMTSKEQGAINHLLNGSTGAAEQHQIFSLLASGKSVKQIDQKVGGGSYMSLSGPGQRLDGKTSWFGGPGDPSDSGQTASGIPESVPGIAVYNHATLRGYWLVQFPNGKKLVLQQTDIGPAPWTGRKVDIIYSALPKAGYTESNFPTDGTVHTRFLGFNVPANVITR